MSGFRPSRGPLAETYQDNLHQDPWLWPGFNIGEKRNAPQEAPFREWDPLQRQWHQGPRRLRNFRPNYYFTRPHDGKRPGTTGRLKDALTGEGADVFVTISGDKRTLMRDRPQRWQWAGWPLTPQEVQDRLVGDKDFREQDMAGVMNTGWTEERAARPFYNYRNREYESWKTVASHPQRVWTNVDWQQGAGRGAQLPSSVRDFNYQWWTSVPWWSRYWPGGRPSD